MLIRLLLSKTAVALTIAGFGLASPSLAQDSAEADLTGFVFETPTQCADGSDGCRMVSFQVYGQAAALIFDGMTSATSAEPDICMDLPYRIDAESGLICYLSDIVSDSLCTFGYDFETKTMRAWAGSC